MLQPVICELKPEESHSGAGLVPAHGLEARKADNSLSSRAACGLPRRAISKESDCRQGDKRDAGSTPWVRRIS